MERIRSRTGQDTAHVVIVGAGIVGLSTAWHLQEHGVDVTVLDRSGVAAGSSWGNAGWISPGLAVPLAEPSVLRYGIKALFDPNSPVFVPIKADPGLAAFLLGFARRCTMAAWRRTMEAYVPLSRMSIDAYLHLEEHGVHANSKPAPITAAFRKAKDSAPLNREIDLIREQGLDLEATSIDGETLRQRLPFIASEVESAIQIDGQRFINPGEYVEAIAHSVEGRGGTIIADADVQALFHEPRGITVEISGKEAVRGDAVVLATGAWLPELARAYGVRTRMIAGRGYSFSVPVDGPPVPSPVYFPQERLACTPMGDRLRIGGSMEFRGVDDSLDSRRIRSLVRSARPLFTGVDLDERQDEWVGSRPVTVDGLFLVGATSAPGVWVHGGHGMWGVSLGPITGKLLAEQMVTGVASDLLMPFAPTR